MGARLPVELPSHQVLSDMARDDPDAYEQLRRDLIERLIDSAPEEFKPRLRGLQFRIDGVRSLSHTALGSTVRVYRLMWDSFVRLNQQMADFRNLSVERDGPATPQAQVIAFRPRSRRDLN